MPISDVSSARLRHFLEISSNVVVAVLSEFSESLRELGACLLEKNALNDDEDSGKYVHVCLGVHASAGKERVFDRFL